jgi:hypothetical protein
VTAGIIPEGIAGVTKDGKFGYIDTTGKYVIAPKFKKGFAFRDGIAQVCDAEVCGYITRKGERLWPRAAAIRKP